MTRKILLLVTGFASCYLSFAQQGNGIILKKFKCAHPVLPDCSQQNIEKRIKTISSLDSAFSLFKGCFHPSLGDEFMLVCKTCPLPNIRKISPSGKFNQIPVDAFGTKGMAEVSSSFDLKKLFSGSLGILNTLSIMLDKLIDRDVFQNARFFIEYSYMKKVYSKEIFVSPSSRSLVFSKSGLFDSLPSSATDNIVLTFYAEKDNKKTVLSTDFRLCFIDPTAKADILEFAKATKETFPEYEPEELAPEIGLYIDSGYGNSYRPNIIEWIQKINL